jgi:hypothetical protein
MSATSRICTLLLLVGCSAGVVTALPSAASAVPAGTSVEVQLTGGSVVTRVEVPVQDAPTYVSRRYTYDLFGTCWSRTGRPRLDLEQRMATATVPFASGSHQMRLPGDTRTSFEFSDPSAMLAHPPTAVLPVRCPKGLTAGVYRASIGDYSVTVLGAAGEDELVGHAGLDHFFAAPVAAGSTTAVKR